MPFGRAVLLVLALAGAMDARLAADPIEAGPAVSLIAAADGPADPPPAVAVAAIAPVPAVDRIAVITELGDRVDLRAPVVAPPLVVAPKTSPPQA